MRGTVPGLALAKCSVTESGAGAAVRVRMISARRESLARIMVLSLEKGGSQDHLTPEDHLSVTLPWVWAWRGQGSPGVVLTMWLTSYDWETRWYRQADGVHCTVYIHHHYQCQAIFYCFVSHLHITPHYYKNYIFHPAWQKSDTLSTIGPAVTNKGLGRWEECAICEDIWRPQLTVTPLQLWRNIKHNGRDEKITSNVTIREAMGDWFHLRK